MRTAPRPIGAFNHMDAASTNADVLLALTAPEPVVRYVEQRVRAAGLRVARVPATATVLKVSAPSATLEREAEHLELEKRLRPEARSCASERHWPMREFVLAQRADFAGAGEGGFFTPSERVFLVTALLEAVRRQRLLLRRARRWRRSRGPSAPPVVAATRPRLRRLAQRGECRTPIGAEAEMECRWW